MHILLIMAAIGIFGWLAIVHPGVRFALLTFSSIICFLASMMAIRDNVDSQPALVSQAFMVGLLFAGLAWLQAYWTRNHRY